MAIKVLGGLLALTTLIICEYAWPYSGGPANRTVVGKVPLRYGVLSFQVHGRASELHTMNVVRDILQQDAGVRELLNYFRYLPERDIHFFVRADTRQFNGFAGLFPHNTVGLYDFPPLHRGELSGSNQWFKLLVLHELAHILHGDQAGGVFAVLRDIFGTIIRPGALVPRWVSEGVAVWAESRFTSFGRLRSTLLRRELYRQLQSSAEGRPGSCHDMGCLDAPGRYPFGAYPYWVGGFFMDYLERENPGTIRCFVERNSSLFPFFFNWAFRDCSGGRSAEHLFAQFRVKFLQHYEDEFYVALGAEDEGGEGGDREETEIGSREVLLPHGEQISWFSGSALLGSTLYYVYWWKREQFVAAYDLATRALQSWAVEGHIERLSRRGHTIQLETYMGQDERGGRRSYRLRDGQFVPLTPGPMRPGQRPEHEFHTEGGGEVSFRYRSWQWTLSNGRGKSRRLPPGHWIFHPEIHRGKIYFKLARERDGLGEVVELHPATLQMRVLYRPQSGNTFFAGSCGGRTYLIDGTHRHTRLVQLGDGGAARSSPQIDRTILALFSPRGVFALEKGGPHFYPGSCRRYLREVRGKGKAKVKAGENGPRAVALSPDIRYQKAADSRRFPTPGHFVPQYWLFNFSSTGGLPMDIINDRPEYWPSSFSGTDGLFSMAFVTELADPQGVHSLVPVGRYYFEHRRLHPEISYTYRFRDLFWGARYQSSLVKKALSPQTGTRKWLKFSVGYRFQGYYWAWRPQLIVGKVALDGLIPSSKGQYYGLQQRLSWNKKRRYSLLNDFALGSIVRRNRFETAARPYWSWHGKVELGFNRDELWRIRGNLGHSRLFKRGHSGGQVLGGGVDHGEGNDYHDFHGLEHSALYGNTITSGGVSVYHRLLAPYRQWGTLPWQWQEVGTVLGSDYARSGHVAIAKRERQDSYAHSVYGGVWAKAKAFYFNQLHLELLYSRAYSGELSQRNVLVSVTGKLF